jgi:type VI secretion system protein ImpK
MPTPLQPPSQTPSLVLTQEQDNDPERSWTRTGQTLVDLLYDGFLMLFLLRNGHEPPDAESYSNKVQQYLETFEQRARKLDIAAEDIFAAKYAFCATVDETILQSNFAIKDKWYTAPLQWTLFGKQLAGTVFFETLEEVRHNQHRIQALEVFHLCLLLGFQGKYAFENQEKLGYMTAKIGDEIAKARSKRGGFAPFWQIPDKVIHNIKRGESIWTVGLVTAAFALLAYGGIHYYLKQETRSTLNEYVNVINYAKSAHVTITLP